MMDTRREWLRRARPYIKPSVKASTQPDLALSRAESPVIRKLAEGLLVLYLVDEGKSFSYVQNRHLAAAEVTEDELHRIAVGNLYDLASDVLRVQPTGPVVAVFMDGNFEASVLLLDTVWDSSLATHVRGEFIVAIPARDVLAFADSSSQEGVDELKAVINRVHRTGADHLISDRLYRRHEGQWETYDA